MQIETTLSSLGLDEKEIAVYLSLLKHKESTVLEVSKYTGVKRPTAYLVLEQLEERGLATRTQRGKKTLYIAQNPNKLVADAELHLRDLKATMPQLEALFSKEKGKPRVVMFEGRDKLDRAMDEAWLLRSDMMFVSTLSLSLAAFPKSFARAEYAKLGPDFQLWELIDDAPESRQYAARVQGPYRHVRYMKKEWMPFEADITLFGTTTLITSVTEELFTISIESEAINRAFKTMFQTMWSVASKS